MSIFSKRKRPKNTELLPDEILLDGQNKPNFNTQQMEGTLEKPITKKSINYLKFFFMLILIIAVGQLAKLQIIEGKEMLITSEDNRLQQIPVFSERGIIYDKNEVELAWNENLTQDEELPFSKRAYIKSPGFSHILGYVGYPTKDQSGFYWRDEIIGRFGIELLEDDWLSGENGQELVEIDALQNLTKKNTIISPTDGKNLHLTIDARLQTAIYNAIINHASENGYQGGAGVVLDIENGDIITLTSYPEFDSAIISEGEDVQTINEYFNSAKKPFLNRAIAGLYTPGSIIKPFIALGALHENIVDENTKILSTGQIEIPNPYNPDQPSIFRDWKDGGHGQTDIYKAIGESVNTYFYAISGGWKNIEGMGISGIEKYIKMFQIGSPTGISIGTESVGVIPTPSWKRKVFNGDSWRLGDTYITSIGQFGFQVTPIQMARAVAGIASSGKLVKPRITNHRPPETSYIEEPISTRDYQIIKDSMRYTVTDGTAQSLNVSYIGIAAKTGTAQVGTANKFINSWVVGFFPYEQPKYAFAIVMERGPNEETTRGASWVLRKALDDLRTNHPEYFTEISNSQENLIDQ